jgi:hypothetical protein
MKEGRIAVIPKPGVLSIKIATGALLPDTVPQRSGATSFRIGQTILSGRELDPNLRTSTAMRMLLGKLVQGKQVP